VPTSNWESSWSLVTVPRSAFSGSYFQTYFARIFLSEPQTPTETYALPVCVTK